MRVEDLNKLYKVGWFHALVHTSKMLSDALMVVHFHSLYTFGDIHVAPLSLSEGGAFRWFMRCAHNPCTYVRMVFSCIIMAHSKGNSSFANVWGDGFSTHFSMRHGCLNFNLPYLCIFCGNAISFPCGSMPIMLAIIVLHVLYGCSSNSAFALLLMEKGNHVKHTGTYRYHG